MVQLPLWFVVFFVPWEVLGGKLFGIVSVDKAVADSDLKMRGGGAGTHPEGGGPVTQKFFFRPFGPQFDLRWIRHCKQFGSLRNDDGDGYENVT